MNLDAQAVHGVVGVAHELIELVIVRKADLLHPLPETIEIVHPRKECRADHLRLRFLDCLPIHLTPPAGTASPFWPCRWQEFNVGWQRFFDLFSVNDFWLVGIEALRFRGLRWGLIPAWRNGKTHLVN